MAKERERSDPEGGGTADELDRELREPTSPELPLVEDPLGEDEPSEAQLALEREARATRSAPRR